MDIQKRQDESWPWGDPISTVVSRDKGSSATYYYYTSAVFKWVPANTFRSPDTTSSETLISAVSTKVTPTKPTDITVTASVSDGTPSSNTPAAAATKGTTSTLASITTTSSSQPQPSEASTDAEVPATTIIGIIAGVCGLVLVLVIAIFLVARRRKRTLKRSLGLAHTSGPDRSAWAGVRLSREPTLPCLDGLPISEMEHRECGPARAPGERWRQLALGSQHGRHGLPEMDAGQVRHGGIGAAELPADPYIHHQWPDH